MKALKKFNDWPLLIFLLNLQNIWNFICWMKDLFKGGADIKITDYNIDINTVLYILTTIALWWMLRTYFRLEYKLNLFIDLQKEISNYRAYMQYKANWVDFQDDSPNGFVGKNIIQPKFEAEKTHIKTVLTNKYPDLSAKKIDEIIDELIYQK